MLLQQQVLPLPFYPLPNMPILGSSNSAANKNMTNGVQSSDRVENIVGKGKIARYEQFLLSPQCF